MPHRKFMKKILFLAMAVGLMAGCGTVAPKPVAATQGSFDAVPDAHGDYQNSGLLGFTNHQAILTATARARYNALCAKWGAKFLPAVKPDDGLISYGPTPPGARGNLWLMDKDHLDKWVTMTRWQANPPTSLGIKPP
jgi:uncharacterized protein YceK